MGVVMMHITDKFMSWNVYLYIIQSISYPIKSYSWKCVFISVIEIISIEFLTENFKEFKRLTMHNIQIFSNKPKATWLKRYLFNHNFYVCINHIINALKQNQKWTNCDNNEHKRPNTNTELHQPSLVGPITRPKISSTRKHKRLSDAWYHFIVMCKNYNKIHWCIL